MFTGIVREIGTVKDVSPAQGGGVRLAVNCEKVNKGIELGDSIAVNGVCLSAVRISDHILFDVVANTYGSTNLRYLRPGSPVNLENAMKLGDSVSGHLVSGHIDGERAIRRITRSEGDAVLEITTIPGDSEYLVPKGAVAIEGVSLTVAEVYHNYFKVYIIPLTLRETSLKLKKAGDRVNLEFDMTAKYARQRTDRSITEELLRENGFM